MNSDVFNKADAIAKAVLYEGYVLYPYRASTTKNRQRCTFGTLYPKMSEKAQQGTEPCRNRTQCILRGSSSSRIVVRVQFLQLRSRQVEVVALGSTEGFRPVAELSVNGELHRSWDDAIERSVEVCLRIGEALSCPRNVEFSFPEFSEINELRDSSGELVGRIRTAGLAITGVISVSAEEVGVGLIRLTVALVNTSHCASEVERGSGLVAAFASAHTMVAIQDGEFVSQLDPPEDARGVSASCKSIGLYPVLVGEPGQHDLLFAPPIILYDYPQIAPESAGDFFDGTEIDEMLTLRVMTLTESEKDELRNSDGRVRELLARTEATTREQLARTHGAIRTLRDSEKKAA